MCILPLACCPRALTGPAWEGRYSWRRFEPNSGVVVVRPQRGGASPPQSTAALSLLSLPHPLLPLRGRRVAAAVAAGAGPGQRPQGQRPGGVEHAPGAPRRETPEPFPPDAADPLCRLRAGGVRRDRRLPNQLRRRRGRDRLHLYHNWHGDRDGCCNCGCGWCRAADPVLPVGYAVSERDDGIPVRTLRLVLPTHEPLRSRWLRNSDGNGYASIVIIVVVVVVVIWRICGAPDGACQLLQPKGGRHERPRAVAPWRRRQRGGGRAAGVLAIQPLGHALRGLELDPRCGQGRGALRRTGGAVPHGLAHSVPQVADSAARCAAPYISSPHTCFPCTHTHPPTPHPTCPPGTSPCTWWRTGRCGASPTSRRSWRWG